MVIRAIPNPAMKPNKTKTSLRNRLETRVGAKTSVYIPIIIVLAESKQLGELSIRDDRTEYETHKIHDKLC
jgi:hypothetical protein